MEPWSAYLLAGAVVVVVAQAIGAWRTQVVLTRVRRFEARLGQVCDVLSLLTETTEAGLKSVAGEIERLALTDTPARDARRTARRITAAARRGRTVQEIAAEETLSEGEVRLRIHLAEAPPAGPAAEKRLPDRGGKGQAAETTAAEPRASLSRRRAASRPSAACVAVSAAGGSPTTK
jgi:hypothetical protein